MLVYIPYTSTNRVYTFDYYGNKVKLVADTDFKKGDLLEIESSYVAANLSYIIKLKKVVGNDNKCIAGTLFIMTNKIPLDKNSSYSFETTNSSKLIYDNKVIYNNTAVYLVICVIRNKVDKVIGYDQVGSDHIEFVL